VIKLSLNAKVNRYLIKFKINFNFLILFVDAKARLLAIVFEADFSKSSRFQYYMISNRWKQPFAKKNEIKNLDITLFQTDKRVKSKIRWFENCHAIVQRKKITSVVGLRYESSRLRIS